MTNSELRRRHDTVADTIARVTWQVGAQVQREVQGLNPNQKQRPDVRIVFPGRMLLTDVAVSHTLTANHIARYESTVLKMQGSKDKKYADVAARLGAELMSFSVESNGGMGGNAVRLVHAISEEGERWIGGAWSSGLIKRQLLGAIGVAVQRGNPLTMLCGFTRAAGGRVRRAYSSEGDGGERCGAEEVKTAG